MTPAFYLLVVLALCADQGFSCDPNNYFFLQKHIPASHSVTMVLNFESASIVQIECISGNIFDLASGFPSFSLTLEAPTAGLVFPLLNSTHGATKCNTSWCIDVALYHQYTALHTTPTSVQWLIRFSNLNMLWNANINLTMSIKEYNVGPAPPPSTGCAPACMPVGTLPLSDCNWYLTPEASWVPRNYAEAASCACTLGNNPASSTPTAQCVRANIHASHVGTQYFSAAMKASLLALEQAHCYGGKSGRHFCTPLYYYYLTSMSFSSIAHTLHQDAYTRCCCPSTVAPLLAWWGIMVAGWAPANFCSLEITLIETVGACGCQNW